MTAYYRDLVAASLGEPESAILHKDRLDEIRRIAAARPPAAWVERIEALMRSRRQIDQNANPRLVTDALAARLVCK